MQRRASQIYIGFAPNFLRQPDWDAPLGNDDLTMAFPARSRNWLDDEETVEEIIDCTGRDLLFELVTAQFARLTIDFDVQPHLLAGWTGFNFGVAASPTGGTNATGTITVNGGPTGGSYQIALTYNFQRQTSAAIAYNLSAAALTAILEAMPNIGAGNIVVTGPNGGPYDYEFQGDLADTIMPGFERASNALTGGTNPDVVPAALVAGSGRSHIISRINGFALPLTTLYVGFRGSDKQPEIFRNVVCDLLRVTSTSRQAVRATIQLIGAADRARAVGYTPPPCLDIEPLRFGDTSLLINGVDQMAANVAREWMFEHNNAVLTDEHAFAGQGINPTRWETADRRPSQLTMSILGESGDTLHTQAKARTPMPFQLNVGPAGNRVQYNIPTGALVRNRPQLDFVGTANESVLRLIGQPRKVQGVAGSPINAVAQTPQTTAYMLTP